MYCIFSYWDPCYDLDLMIDRVSLDLLYLQLIEEVDLGWIITDQQSKEILSSYEAKKQKREVRFYIYYAVCFNNTLIIITHKSLVLNNKII